MSKGLICDNCGTTLTLKDNGDAENGEDAAWIVVTTRGFGTNWDACTRSCAVELINGEIGEVVDAELEVISSIARTIREDRARDADGDGDDE